MILTTGRRGSRGAMEKKKDKKTKIKKDRKKSLENDANVSVHGKYNR